MKKKNVWKNTAPTHPPFHPSPSLPFLPDYPCEHRPALHTPSALSPRPHRYFYFILQATTWLQETHSLTHTHTSTLEYIYPASSLIIDLLRPLSLSPLSSRSDPHPVPSPPFLLFACKVTHTQHSHPPTPPLSPTTFILLAESTTIDTTNFAPRPCCVIVSL